MKQFWVEYGKRVWAYLTSRPRSKGDFWRRFGFILIWPFNIASFVLGTVGSLLLIERLPISPFWLEVVGIFLISALSLLLLQGLFSLIDEIVYKAHLPETPIDIFVLLGMIAGSSVIVYDYLQTHLADSQFVGGSAITAIAIKIAPTLIVILMAAARGIVGEIFRRIFTWWFPPKKKPPDNNADP